MARVRSKHKMVSFTTIVLTPAKFDMKGHLTGVSIDLEDDNLLFEVKNLKCLEDNDDLIILFAYASALGLDFCSKGVKWALSQALTELWGEPPPVPEIKVFLNYPPHAEYKLFKKGRPKSKYPAKYTRGLQVRYNAEAEEDIKGGQKIWKKYLRQVVGSHAFVREIPGEDAGTTSVKKFREDCNVHTTAQCCITTGTLTGVAYLDTKLVISHEKDDKMVDEAEMCLRDVLTDVMVEGKPLIRVVAEVDASTAMVISATSADRDAALANTRQYTAAWAMYTLIFTHKASTASVETALKSWFEITHAKAAMDYSVYDRTTGMVSLDVDSGDPEEREAQEVLSKGLVDMSILKGEDIDVGNRPDTGSTPTNKSTFSATLRSQKTVVVPKS